MKKQAIMAMTALLIGLQTTACNSQKEAVEDDDIVYVTTFTTTTDDGRKKLSISNFNSIEGRGLADVYFTQSADYSAEVVDPDNVLKKCYVKDNCLIIETRSGTRGNVRRPKVYLTASALNSLSISGITNFHADNIEANDIKFKVSGVGKIYFKTIHCKSFTANESGVSEINGRVVAQQATISCSGVSKDKVDVEADQLTVNGTGQPKMELTFKGKTANIKNSGAGTIDIDVNCERLKADNSGVAKLNISGTADDTNINSSGVSKVDVSRLNRY